MNADFFIDTNVLVYSIDENDLLKQKIAQNLLEKLVKDKNAIVSTQSLQEFYNSTTRKGICEKDKAMEFVKYFSNAFPVFNNSVSEIISAIEISIKTQFSFWDSLIIAAAKSAGCKTIYSEDLNDGQIVDGIKIENPFK